MVLSGWWTADRMRSIRVTWSLDTRALATRRCRRETVSRRRGTRRNPRAMARPPRRRSPATRRRKPIPIRCTIHCTIGRRTCRGTRPHLRHRHHLRFLLTVSLLHLLVARARVSRLHVTRIDRIRSAVHHPLKTMQPPRLPDRLSPPIERPHIPLVGRVVLAADRHLLPPVSYTHLTLPTILLV